MLVAGQTYRSTYTITGLDGPPDTVTLTVTLPDGTLLTPPPAISEPIVDGTTYTWTCDYTLTAGLTGFTWTTTGPGTSEPADWVRADEFRSILSLAEAREFLDVRDTSRDEVLAGMLNGITRLIERQIGTVVIRPITGEWIPGDVRDVIRLPSAPVPTTSSVTSITSVYPAGPSWTASDLIVNPAAGTVRLTSLLPFWYGPWTWTGTAGRAELDPDIIEGAKAALYDLWAVQRGVSADQLEPDLAEVTAYETAVPPGWRLPPRVMQFLDAERMPGFA